MKQIKNNKQYLKKYITAFELNKNVCEITNDITGANKMILNIQIFKLFMLDIEKFNHLQVSLITNALVNPEMESNIMKLRSKQKRKKLTDIEIKIILNYEQAKYIRKVCEFFKYHSLTKKNILTSLSISLYKAVVITDKISKYQAKEILEVMFNKMDMPTTIRITDIDGVYIKTLVDNLQIYAYPSSKDIQSLYNFNDIKDILSTRMDSYSDNPSKLKKLDKYINTKIAHLQERLDI